MMPLTEYLKQTNKKAKDENWSEKDWDKEAEQYQSCSTLVPNNKMIIRDEMKVMVRFIQSKKSGYLTPQEHANYHSRDSA